MAVLMTLGATIVGAEVVTLKFAAIEPPQAPATKLVVMTAFGGTPVGIPITKTAESISRGVVAGTMSDLNALASFRIADVARHH